MAKEKQLLIEVRDKIATLKSKNFNLVGGNNDYDVVFDFDEDWQDLNAKTAIFVFDNENPVYVPFDGNVCEGVAINDATMCLIGVFSGDLRTTTPAVVDCVYRSILDEANGTPAPPKEDVYNQIIDLINKYIKEIDIVGKYAPLVDGKVPAQYIDLKIDVVQKTGDSETSVMSQKAATDNFALKGDLDDLIMSLEKNLIPIATIEKGYVGADKEFYKTTSWEALKIPASNISLISHSSLFTNNALFYAISFYSTETITASSFISGVQFGELDNVNFYNVNVPDNAEIIVVCNRIASGECVVNGIDASVINVIDENIQSVKENTLSNLTLLDCDYTKKGYLNQDGSFVSNASWKCYLFNIENLQVDSLNASIYSNNLNFNSIAFYNDLIISTGTFIEGLSPKGISDTIIDFTNVKVPVDAKMVVIATRTATAKDETAIIRVVQGGLLFKDMYSDKVNHDYYKGQLKNVYENLGIANDITFVGDELWGGAILNNDTGETQINRYKLTDMGYVLLGSIHTDFGHLNSMDYNAQNDCLIFGNGGNGFETDNNWFAIVKNPLALGASATLAENATIFNVNVGYKVQAVWGDENLGLNNIVYLLSNNGQTITRVFLNLDGNGDFDGTYKVLETKELDKSYFVGGCKYWGDTLYIGYADNTYKIAEISMTDYTAKIVHKHFYRSDGTELVGTTQGVHIDSKYLWVFVNSTNPINNYLLQYYR